MDEKPLIAITVSNPATPNKASLILVECANTEAARRLARKIAEETGRSVTVRDTDMREIDTILLPTTH